MPEISDSLRLLFETSVEDEGDRYTVAIPKELVENGSLDTSQPYRVALLAAGDGEQTEAPSSRGGPPPGERPPPLPPPTPPPPPPPGRHPGGVEINTRHPQTRGEP